MGDFFAVQAGGGQYPTRPSPASNRAAAAFLGERANFSSTAQEWVLGRSVAGTMQSLTALQGCALWKHPPDLPDSALTKQQRELIGKGFAGPAVDIGGVSLSPEQRQRCCEGLDEQQLRKLKAEVQHKIPDFHEVIDRAVSARARLRATGQLAGRSEQSEQKEATTVYVNNQQHQDELSVAFSRNGGELPAGTKDLAPSYIGVYGTKDTAASGSNFVSVEISYSPSTARNPVIAKPSTPLENLSETIMLDSSASRAGTGQTHWM